MEVNEKMIKFVDKNKKPVEWILKPVSSQLDEDLRRQSTIRTKNATGQYQTDLDVNKYIGLLAVACTVYPNLNDANLQNSYNVMGADSLLKTMLLPGEYANYLLKVQEICGFDKNIDDMVKQAKN